MNFFENIGKARQEQRAFECDKHGAYMAECLVFPDGSVKQTGCPKCIEAEERAELAEKKKRQEEKWRRENIEPEFYGKTFDDFKPRTDSQRKALEAVRSMTREKRGKVVLVGPNGVGKTMLASIACMELGGYVYSMYEISAMIRQSYTVRAERSELEIVRELASVPFLAIDELGRTKGGEAEQNWLSYILDKRHARSLPFMMMSNGHFKRDCRQGGCPRCFENIVDNDVLSRLHQDSTVILIDAPDERVQRRSA